MNPAARHRGFTLIEVLIALAILAFGMLAVIGAGGVTARNTSRLRDDTFASWVGLNELTMLRVAQSWPSADTLEGDSDMGGSADKPQKWHWKATMSKTSDPGLLRIDIDVSTADKPDDPVTRVTGFMGLPPGQQGNLTAP